MKENIKRVPLELIDFTINTAEDIDSQITEIVNKLKNKQS